MATVTVKLTPLDVLFFRDARPFGVSDFGQSGLPTPQAFAGLIKTRLMTFAELRPADLHGLHDRQRPRQQWHWLARVQTRGPWLHAGGPLVTVPADLMQIGKSGDGLVRLRPLPDSVPLPGWQPPLHGMRPLWSTRREALHPVTQRLLDRVGLGQYLANDPATGGLPHDAHVHDLQRFVTWEDRTGIGIDPESRTAAKRQIYSARFLRLHRGVCFAGELELPDDGPPVPELFPPGLTLPWGGEGRRVRIDVQQGPLDWPTVANGPIGQRLLTVLITPGIFHSRDVAIRPLWRPSENGQLIAAAVPKPLAVSGWDLAGDAAQKPTKPIVGRPRPTRYAAPAGSVYFWRRGRARAESEPAHFPPHCDKPRDHDTGWGVALTGTWNECDLEQGT